MIRAYSGSRRREMLKVKYEKIPELIENVLRARMVDSKLP